eukprot:6725911-Prymnesium_polylepis.1
MPCAPYGTNERGDAVHDCGAKVDEHDGAGLPRCQAQRALEAAVVIVRLRVAVHLRAHRSWERPPAPARGTQGHRGAGCVNILEARGPRTPAAVACTRARVCVRYVARMHSL